jgi:hypothetical protein
MEDNRFITIRQAAKRGPLPEHRLRVMKAEGRLPGFAAGTRWYVDYPKLLELLDKMTTIPEE